MRVIVVNNHRPLRRALGRRVQTLLPGTTVLEVAHATAVREHLAEGGVGLVVVHAHTPEGRGVAPLVRLCRKDPAVRLLVVSDVLNAARVRRVLRDGADGCIGGSAPDRVMRHALDLVLSGETFVPPEVLSGERAA